MILEKEKNNLYIEIKMLYGKRKNDMKEGNERL